MRTILALFIVGLIFSGCMKEIITTNNQTTENSKISSLIPLYINPTDFDENTKEVLQHIVDNTEETISIINPNSGPGDEMSQNYVDFIKELHNMNSKVIGYVATGYAQKNLDDIKSEIDKYSQFYSLDGIFFDETDISNAKNNDQYKELASYVRSKGYDIVAVNAGTKVPQEFIDENIYDIVLTFENTYERFKEFNENENSSSTVSKQSILIHGFDPTDDKQEVIDKCEALDYKYIYITIDGEDNPWDSLYDFIPDNQ